MTTRSDEFGRLLKAGIGSIANCEGKTAPAIEAALGEQIGVSGYSIQHYKAGHVPPDPRTVKILAEACVRRGLLGRSWLERFLRAAHYPQPGLLLDALCPAGTAAPAPAAPYDNLPAPAYSQFVMREHAYADLLEGLSQRRPVVIVSLGGMGKTSLAREVAARSLAAEGAGPRFDAVVWVSDKERPGSANLSLLLDEIARTLDYPGLAQYAHDDKRAAVEQLLRRQRVLVVADNFETITDNALAEWLLRLPEPSKALITTRTARPILRDCWQVELGGMTAGEARVLVRNRLRALKLTELAGDLDLFGPLIDAAGGNPKAIELALGLVKYSHQPIQQASAELQAAHGALFDDLFARSWALLDEPARRVLLALPLFAEGASPAALGAIADLPAPAFGRATELLADLALLDVQRSRADAAPRFGQHPLVRAFAQARLAEAPDFEQSARERWLAWYADLAAQVGFCWRDLSRLDRLDPEHANLHLAIEWAVAQGRDATAIALIEGVRYYYNVRGLWDGRLAINAMRVAAARRIGDRANEALGLAFDVEIYSKQGQLDRVAALLPRLDELAAEPGLPPDVVFEIGHARALYARAQGDLPGAERIWRGMPGLSAQLEAQKSIVNRRWLATCLLEQGDREQALRLFHDSLADARTHGDVRSVLGNTLKIAAITLAQGDLAGAAAALAECRAGAERLRDRRRLSELYRLSAQLHALQGQPAAARANLATAIDLFERMGMRQDLAGARRELDQLGAIEGAD